MRRRGRPRRMRGNGLRPLLLLRGVRVVRGVREACLRLRLLRGTLLLAVWLVEEEALLLRREGVASVAVRASREDVDGAECSQEKHHVLERIKTQRQMSKTILLQKYHSCFCAHPVPDTPSMRTGRTQRADYHSRDHLRTPSWPSQKSARLEGRHVKDSSSSRRLPNHREAQKQSIHAHSASMNLSDPSSQATNQTKPPTPAISVAV